MHPVIYFLLLNYFPDDVIFPGPINAVPLFVIILSDRCAVAVFTAIPVAQPEMTELLTLALPLCRLMPLFVTVCTVHPFTITEPAGLVTLIPHWHYE